MVSGRNSLAWVSVSVYEERNEQGKSHGDRKAAQSMSLWLLLSFEFGIQAGIWSKKSSALAGRCKEMSQKGKQDEIKNRVCSGII